MGIRERLDSLSRGELVGLIAVVVVTLAGAGLWFQRSLPATVQIAASGSPAPPASDAASPHAVPSSTAAPGSPSAGSLIVDVAGMVRRPGVYEFQPGDRVIDAVDRAGGALPRADLTVVNLAAPLTDGQQVVIPKEGTAGAPGTVTAPDGTSVVNINTADATALEALPGIGEVLAAAIVSYRDEHGPFTSIEQLQDVSGIGPATFGDIQDQVTV
jgi:competence protein ComEA